MAKNSETTSRFENTKLSDFTGLAVKSGEEFQFNLSDFSGKKLVVYFYPKDNTSGCTNEAIGFEESSSEFEKRGYSIIGISSDPIKSHKNFAEKKNLNFTLISDEDKNIHSLFGTWQMKKMCGREYMGTVRTTFIVNESGTIIKEFSKVNTKTHAVDVLDYIDSL